MERVIYYLMLLFGFLIMQRIYKWRVENGKNKSNEMNTTPEEREDKKVKELEEKERLYEIKKITENVMPDDIGHVVSLGFLNTENLVSGHFEKVYPLSSVIAKTQRLFHKKVMYDDLKLSRSLEDYNADLKKIVKQNFHLVECRVVPRVQLVNKRIFGFINYGVDVKEYFDVVTLKGPLINAGFFDGIHHLGKGVVFLKRSDVNGLLLCFSFGDGKISQFSFDEIFTYLESNRVYFFDMFLFENGKYKPSTCYFLDMDTDKSASKLYNYIQFFVEKYRQANAHVN